MINGVSFHKQKKRLTLTLTQHKNIFLPSTETFLKTFASFFSLCFCYKSCDNWFLIFLSVKTSEFNIKSYLFIDFYLACVGFNKNLIPALKFNRLVQKIPTQKIQFLSLGLLNCSGSITITFCRLCSYILD